LCPTSPRCNFPVLARQTGHGDTKVPDDSVDQVAPVRDPWRSKLAFAEDPLEYGRLPMIFEFASLVDQELIKPGCCCEGWHESP